MVFKSFLIPTGFRPLGIIFFISGIALSVLKFSFNYKPDFLDINVFAFYSFYIEAKAFSLIKHQMLGEIAGLLLLSGLFLIAFTKEKLEAEVLDSLRLRAFFFATYLNFFYLIISILFFFGFGFVGALTIFALIWLATYVIVFRILFCRYKKRSIPE